MLLHTPNSVNGVDGFLARNQEGSGPMAAVSGRLNEEYFDPLFDKFGGGQAHVNSHFCTCMCAFSAFSSRHVGMCAYVSMYSLEETSKPKASLGSSGSSPMVWRAAP